LILAGAAPIGMWLAPQDRPAAAPKVGVVDLQRLFKADVNLVADIAAINARAKEYDDEMSKMRDEHKELQMQCQQMSDKSSEKYVRTVAAMFAKEEHLDKLKVGFEAYLKSEGTRVNLAAFRRYRGAIAELASKMGIDIVLRQSDLDDKEHSLGARAQAAELSVVLYHDPKLDLTEGVLQLLKATSK